MAHIATTIFEEKLEVVAKEAGLPTSQLENEEGGESVTIKLTRLRSLKTFLCLVLKRFKDSAGEGGSVVEEVLTVGRNVGWDVDEEELRGRVREAEVYEEEERREDAGELREEVVEEGSEELSEEQEGEVDRYVREWQEGQKRKGR